VNCCCFKIECTRKHTPSILCFCYTCIFYKKPNNNVTVQPTSPQKKYSKANSDTFWVLALHLPWTLRNKARVQLERTPSVMGSSSYMNFQISHQLAVPIWFQYTKSIVFFFLILLCWVERFNPALQLNLYRWDNNNY
jgi:hypothetical protein